jgi:hypothetical protein
MINKNIYGMNDQIANKFLLLTDLLMESERIPSFIDTKRFNHKVAYKIAEDIFLSLSVLLDDRIVSNSVLDKTYNRFCNYLTDIEIQDQELGLLYEKYFIKVLKRYRNESIDMELYETSANITYVLKKIIPNNV